MIGVLRVGDSGQEVRIDPRATAIFGRAGVFARSAYRVFCSWFGGQFLLDSDFVIPIVAEVIGVLEFRAWSDEFVEGVSVLVEMAEFSVGGHAIFTVVYAELMQVAVVPAHDDLDAHMEFA